MPRRIAVPLVIITASLLAACHSKGIDVTIQNNARVAIRNVELDYPGAAFGTGMIAPGASYWYHIKPTAEADVKLSFEPGDGRPVMEKGPHLKPGDEGRLILILDEDAGHRWQLRVERH